MSHEAELRRSLTHAVGSSALGVSIIDNSPDPCPTCAKVRTALLNGVSAQPRLCVQTCPTGQHPNWLAEGENLPCPSCRELYLMGVLEDLERRLAAAMSKAAA